MGYKQPAEIDADQREVTDVSELQDKRAKRRLLSRCSSHSRRGQPADDGRRASRTAPADGPSIHHVKRDGRRHRKHGRERSTSFYFLFNSFFSLLFSFPAPSFPFAAGCPRPKVAPANLRVNEHDHQRRNAARRDRTDRRTDRCIFSSKLSLPRPLCHATLRRIRRARSHERTAVAGCLSPEQGSLMIFFHSIPTQHKDIALDPRFLATVRSLLVVVDSDGPRQG